MDIMSSGIQMKMCEYVHWLDGSEICHNLGVVHAFAIINVITIWLDGAEICPNYRM